jgi:ferredoxin-type protein NapH
VRRAGALQAVANDVTSRGPSAWLLAAVLLGFYFGLYVPAETARLLTWLGHGVWLLGAGVAAVTVLVHAWFARRDRTLVPRDEAVLGAKVFALAMGTAGLSAWFARALAPAEHHGRHLLLSPGVTWSTPALAALLGAALAMGALGALRAWRARGDTGAALREATWSLLGAQLAAVTLAYGTHLFDPGAAPAAGDHSPRAFAALLYLALDSKWTLYGLLYTCAVSAGGLYMLGRYLHNRYQVARTLVVIGVQATFGFSVPVLLKLFAQPEYYLSYFWPLKIDAFYPDNILRDPAPFVLWSFLGSLLLVPLMGIFFGKRWYCSWVCGCGGLANTAGEPFRHLSQKGEAAWRFEQASIYTVLGLAVVTTVLVALSALVGPHSALNGVWWSGTGGVSQWRVDGGLHSDAIVTVASKARYYYGLIVVAVLSGAIGVGLYPLGGTRQWCRNFCPMAALLGLLQKVGRYRIRVKADMCISCGMCTQYCEMGIDVRAYAQSNETFVRASCVGCGMCAEVCPRGVLSLEQRWTGVAAKRARPDAGLVQLRLRK